MPISRKVLFECQNCGYTETRTIGDVRPDPAELKPCPKCDSRMVISRGDARGETFIDRLKSIFQ